MKTINIFTSEGSKSRTISSPLFGHCTTVIRNGSKAFSVQLTPLAEEKIFAFSFAFISSLIHQRPFTIDIPENVRASGLEH